MTTPKRQPERDPIEDPYDFPNEDDWQRGTMRSAPLTTRERWNFIHTVAECRWPDCEFHHASPSSDDEQPDWLRRFLRGGGAS